VLLRILHLEDDRLDGELVRETLAAGGLEFDIERVQTHEAFERALSCGHFDLVLSDFTLPSYDGATALAHVLRTRPEVPFILVSGTVGEEAAINSLLAGATDYVLKARLQRLVPAVQRAVREADERRARKEAEQAVRASEQRYRRLFEAAAFLSKAAALLSESLDYEKTLAGLSRLCVESLADWCVLDLLEGREICRLAGACADPAKEALLEMLRQRYPVRWGSPHPAARVLRSGEPFWMPAVTEEMLRSTCEDDEHLEMVRGLGTRSVVAVPMVARGQTLGVLTLASATSGRYGSADFELVKEVARRAASAIENARLYREVQRADRRKSEFIAVLSHELRNPLAPIRTGLQLVRRSPPGSAIASRALEIITRQTEHMSHLLDDLLDITRVSHGKIELHRARLDLRDLVRSACDDLLASLDRAEVALHVELPPVALWIEADATRVAQVLGNLLHNAAKFTHAGGSVTVGAIANGTYAEVSVRDTGVGMEPGEVERMFAPFTQAEQGLARTQGGLGLGLALAKGLVELHGGKIRARSEGSGRGSEFVVTLPLSSLG
jgi:signal transduction histidine kinase/CheY-like chemotaxis protein